MLSEREYLASLRYTLNHLYDPNALRNSPLAEWLNLTDRSAPISALRQALIDAIESLKPGKDVPAHSHLWRVYEILLYRYVQQASQKEVADQLGISVRHLRREQRDALEVLGRRVCEQSGLDLTAVERESTSQDEEAECPSVGSELDWLESSVDETSSLKEILPGVVALAEPIARQHHVHLCVAGSPDVPALAVHPVALRQILLSLLSSAIRQRSGGSIALQICQAHWNVDISVQMPHAEREPADRTGDTVLEQLVEVCGGTLRHCVNEHTSTATVSLPAAQQVPIVAIDDNEDALHLYHRYAAGTRYRLIGITDPEEIFVIADDLGPQLILLDVMMPHVDGWAMLGRLKEHPLTRHVPVVVCTILPERELALSLGADGFAQKPISREAFLHLLQSQTIRQRSGSD